MRVGIIGGSGLCQLECKSELISIETPFGKPSSNYEIFSLDGQEVYFLKRHGEGHIIPPHRVNYRANVYGFRELGVERIFGVFAVGSLDERISPGTIVIPDQVIDFTQGMRENTFYEGPKVVHVDFTHPFCEELRSHVRDVAQRIGIPIHFNSTYVCVNGPRLETQAEIKFFSNIGAHIIGMTLMPEAVLARELEICYCAITVVVNFAAGISKTPLTVEEVKETMKGNLAKVNFLLTETIKSLPYERGCRCKDALKGASF